ncbi:hypothetical protein GCM10020256_54370 [Streptomyces thermocoprophilus]
MGRDERMDERGGVPGASGKLAGEPRTHQCPECGAPRAGDGTPSCGCTQRASEALRDARTAAQAAAEDFDPLRIRPYVALGDGAGGQTAGVDAGEETMALRAVPSDAAAGVPAPSATDLSLFEAGAEAGAPPSEGQAQGQDVRRRPSGRRRRRAVLLGGVRRRCGCRRRSGAGRRVPLVRHAVPEDRGDGDGRHEGGGAGRVGRGAGGTERVGRGAGPGVRDARRHGGGDAVGRALGLGAVRGRIGLPRAIGERLALGGGGRRGKPTAPAGSTAPATPPPSGTPTAPDDRRRPDMPVLRRGDRGPEVVELQLRLGQLYLYTGPADGIFDDRVEQAVRTYQWARGVWADGIGLYGAETRRALESETAVPPGVR